MNKGETCSGSALFRIHFAERLSGKRILWRVSASVPLLAVFLFSWFGWSPLPPCRFKTLTGYSCPTCGMTRSFQALAHGEFLESFRYNPMGPVFLFILLIVFAKLSLEVTMGRKVTIGAPQPLLRGSIALLFGLWLGFGMTRLLLEIAAKG